MYAGSNPAWGDSYKYEMITFKTHLAESLTKALPYKLSNEFIGNDNNLYIYTFALSGHMVEVVCEVDFVENAISVAFNVDGYEDVTGEVGTSAIQIFATVAQIVRTVYKRYQGYRIWFEAATSETSRVKLYNKFALRVAQELGSVKSITIVRVGRNTRFIVTPK